MLEHFAKMSSHKNILALGMLLGLIITVQSFFFDDEAKADIAPLDALVFIGETLKMECTLTDSAGDVSTQDMYFDIQGGRGELWRVPRENTTIASDRMIYAEVLVTEENHSKITTWTCMGGSQYLASTFVYAERPIRNVSYFHGIYYYGKSVNLSWKLGEYLDPDNIQVRVDWNPFLPPNLSGNACSIFEKESCILSKDNFAEQATLFFRIEVFSKRWKNRPAQHYLQSQYEATALSVHRFVVMDKLQTGPPSGVSIQSKTSQCFTVTWMGPPYFSTCQCDQLYKITVQGPDEGAPKVVRDSETKRWGEQQPEVEICSLTPYTLYTVNVHVKANLSNPWSVAATVQDMTDEDSK